MSHTHFDLWDLKVEVIRSGAGKIYSGAQEGDYFELRGEMLHLPEGQGFSIYSLGALVPLLAAKQRQTDPADWITTDTVIGNPDPNCPTQFRITRTKLRRFEHAETTKVPMGQKEDDQ